MRSTMYRMGILLSCLWITMVTYAAEIDYMHCYSIQDAIARETEEITHAYFTDHDELSLLYVSRGESYLFDGQYEKAIDDFETANYHLGHSQNIKDSMPVAFRTALGKVVSCDNLGLHDLTQQSIHQLQEIARLAGCGDCLGEMHNEETSPIANQPHFQDMVNPCKHKKDKHENSQQQQRNADNYSDIVGPDQVPPNWCEEVVTGVGRSMDAIACLAPNYIVKVVLIGVIEALITRGVKCCQAGDFWKACAAPICRKWQQWDNFKKNHILPNKQNLPMFEN
jgi:hypothetical protein